LSLIEVQDLRKEFRVFQHREGVWGAFRDLFGRNYRTLAALDGVSLSVEEGEFVGYIGPNGAGKSTTIKMLTGILMPTSGCIQAAGMRPYYDRARYTRAIGVVFGQRTQLWWDIAVIESFRLLKRIYDIPTHDYEMRLGIFREMLGLDEFLHSPVRKLSLGQRMRCDIAAALLHNPRIVFLDEPTIGLDVVAKANIRVFLKEINRTRRTTILLTTHDLSDIEELCRRVVIIDHGRILIDGNLEDLRQRLGRHNRISVHLRAPGDTARLAAVFAGQQGIELERTDELSVQIRCDREVVSSAQLIRRIVDEVPIRDIFIEAEPIEEIVKNIYSGKLQTANA
jgi:ABC-2 type transport system ATP-binding protein